MNATLQSMRAIPELQTALEASQPSGLPGSLKQLYTEMSKTTEEVTPILFLSALRQAFPQFAEIARGQGGAKGGYAQQGDILH
jgi:ubiquitin carboxyl-terminal hydrolase 14